MLFIWRACTSESLHWHLLVYYYHIWFGLGKWCLSKLLGTKSIILGAKVKFCEYLIKLVATDSESMYNNSTDNWSPFGIYTNVFHGPCSSIIISSSECLIWKRIILHWHFELLVESLLGVVQLILYITT